jgi:hypothetical protein
MVIWDRFGSLLEEVDLGASESLEGDPSLVWLQHLFVSSKRSMNFSFV